MHKDFDLWNVKKKKEKRIKFDKTKDQPGKFWLVFYISPPMRASPKAICMYKDNKKIFSVNRDCYNNLNKILFHKF